MREGCVCGKDLWEVSCEKGGKRKRQVVWEREGERGERTIGESD